MGGAQGIGQCNKGNVVAPQSYIFAQGFVKQSSILGDGCKQPPLIGQRHLRRDHTANRDLASVWVQQSCQQMEYSRFASPGCPNQGRCLPGVCGKRQTPQHGLVAMGKGHLVKDQSGCAGGGQRRALAWAAAGWCRIKQRINPLKAGGGNLPGACHFAQPSQGLKRQRHCREK